MRLIPKQSRAQRAVRAVRRYLRRFRPPRTEVDRALRDFASRRGRDVFFVQIGSNDGISRDPLFDYVRRYSWSGILVEPIPELVAQLRANYRGARSLAIENAVIGERDEDLDFWWIEDPEGQLPPWANRIGSLSRDQVLTHQSTIPGLERFLVRRKVRSLTFDSLLAKHAASRLDLLHIDAEGWDYRILQQVDFDRLKPEVIIYEHVHLGDDDRAACERMIAAHGYTLIKGRDDTIAVRDSEPAG